MIKTIMSLVWVLLFSAMGISASPDYLSGEKSGASYPPAEGKALYRVSVVAVIGTSATDAASSWGRLEANPLLRSGDGQFGGKGLIIKAGLTAGILVMNHYVLRRSADRRRRKLATVSNFVVAAVFGTVTAVNLKRR